MPALWVNAQYPLSCGDDDQKLVVIEHRQCGQMNARDGVHEGDVDPDGLCDQIFHFSKHRQLVLRLDVFWVSRVQASD